MLVDEEFVEIESKFIPRVEKALIGALARVVPGYFYGSHRRSVEYAYKDTIIYILYYAKVIEILSISVTSLQIVTLAGKPQLM